MLRENLRIFRKLLFAADISLVAFAFQQADISAQVFHGSSTNFYSSDSMILPVSLIWGIVLWYHPGCYVFRLKKIGEIVLAPLRASLVAAGLFLGYLFLMGFVYESRLQIALFVGISASFLILIRLVIWTMLSYYRARGYNYQTVLIIGTGSLAKNFVDKVLKNINFGLKIIGFLDWEKRPELWRYRDIPSIGHLDDLPEILKRKQVDFVVFAVGRKFLGTIEKSVRICEEMGVRVSILADFFTPLIARRKIESFFDSPMVCYDPAPSLNLSIVLKGLYDRILAAVGIALALPVMLVAALAVKLSSPGPVIFSQPRCGLNGRKFTLYKFRTMVKDAEALKNSLMRFNEVNGAAFKMKNDPRITAVGQLLRKTSIDELPQLFNILKGDMSFVGPRPPLAEEVINYDRWQRRKLSMKPGLTCLWQISGRSNVSFEQWMKLDLEYIDNWSLWKDAQIMFKTVPAVLKGTGAR